MQTLTAWWVVLSWPACDSAQVLLIMELLLKRLPLTHVAEWTKKLVERYVDHDDVHCRELMFRVLMWLHDNVQVQLCRSAGAHTTQPPEQKDGGPSSRSGSMSMSMSMISPSLPSATLNFEDGQYVVDP